jgi:hypothetical protein
MNESEPSDATTTDAMTAPDGNRLILPRPDFRAIMQAELLPAALGEDQRFALPEVRLTDDMPSLCRWLGLAVVAGLSGHCIESSTGEVERKQKVRRGKGTTRFEA